MSTEAFFELRLYDVEAGRIGDMVDRLRGPLAALFRRHGIDVVGAWQSTAGPRVPLFVYLMRWESMQQRDAAWGGFYADPEWHAARTETNRGSELVERFELHFLRDITPWQAVPAAVVELQWARVAIGAGAAARRFLTESAAERLAPDGGRLLGAFECMTGIDLPRACVFVGWDSGAGREAGVGGLQVPPLGRADRYLLKPVGPQAGQIHHP